MIIVSMQTRSISKPLKDVCSERESRAAATRGFFCNMFSSRSQTAIQGAKLISFPDSHLAPKFFKVVANSKKVGCHFVRQTKLFLCCQCTR